MPQKKHRNGILYHKRSTGTESYATKEAQERNPMPQKKNPIPKGTGLESYATKGGFLHQERRPSVSGVARSPDLATTGLDFLGLSA
jgi:hypothetical protein